MRFVVLGLVTIYAVGVLAVGVSEAVRLGGEGWTAEAVFRPALETALSWPYDLYRTVR